MRISDWSSDVCSSDLIFKPAGLHEVAKDVDVPIGNGRVEPFIGIGAIGEVEELVAKLRRGLAFDSADFFEDVIREIVKRSEARRVGKECVCTCRSWRWQNH